VRVTFVSIDQDLLHTALAVGRAFWYLLGESSDSVRSPRRARVLPDKEFQIPNSKFQERTIRESGIWNPGSGIGNLESRFGCGSAALGINDSVAARGRF
jgi:hypothetical protein